jgi:hypothetical protein
MRKTWVGFLCAGLLVLTTVILWLAGGPHLGFPLVGVTTVVLIGATYQAIRNSRRVK